MEKKKHTQQQANKAQMECANGREKMRKETKSKHTDTKCNAIKRILTQHA